MECFGENRCVGGEKGCRSIMGCLGRKWGALRCLGVKGVFGGVKGGRRHKVVFGAQMRCWPWGERGVWWMKRGVWWRKVVFVWGVSESPYGSCPIF